MLREFEIMFDYLDWCKSKGITKIEKTENRELIKQFSEETNTSINGLALGLLNGKLFKINKYGGEE